MAAANSGSVGRGKAFGQNPSLRGKGDGPAALSGAAPSARALTTHARGLNG